MSDDTRARKWLPACTLLALASVFFTAHAVTASALVLIDDIRPGTIRSIETFYKGDLLLRFDNGQEHVLWGGGVPAKGGSMIFPKVGDRIEKRWGSWIYKLNGRPTGDPSLIVRHSAPAPLFMLIYLLCGGAFVLRFRRNPLGFMRYRDGFISARPLRYLATSFIAMILSWGILVLLAATALSIIAMCSRMIIRLSYG